MTSIAIDRRDGLSSATAVKGPCRVATTANISLSGTQTIDGVAVVADDRVLVKNQSTASENGIYVADTGSWARAKDFSRNRDVQKGTQVYVTDGSVGSGQYRVTTSNPIEIGTTSIAFALAATGGGMTLLDTLATTSGTSVSTTASFAGYRGLYVEFDGVSFDGTVALRITASTSNGSSYGTNTTITGNLPAAGSTISGWIEIGGIQLASSNHGLVGAIAVGAASVAPTALNVVGDAAAAITNLRFLPVSGNFDAGAIRVYGIA